MCYIWLCFSFQYTLKEKSKIMVRNEHLIIENARALKILE